MEESNLRLYSLLTLQQDYTQDLLFRSNTRGALPLS